jgi:hypothetical protein
MGDRVVRELAEAGTRSQSSISVDSANIEQTVPGQSRNVGGGGDFGGESCAFARGGCAGSAVRS